MQHLEFWRTYGFPKNFRYLFFFLPLFTSSFQHVYMVLKQFICIFSTTIIRISKFVVQKRYPSTYNFWCSHFSLTPLLVLYVNRTVCTIHVHQVHCRVFFARSLFFHFPHNFHFLDFEKGTARHLRDNNTIRNSIDCNTIRKWTNNDRKVCMKGICTLIGN